MNSKLVALVLVLVLLSGAGALAWFLGGAPEAADAVAPRAPEPASASPVANDPLELAEAARDPGPAEAARESVEAPDTAPEPEPTGPSDGTPPARASGRCVDELGRPLQGVLLDVRGRSEEPATSDEDGRFLVEVSLRANQPERTYDLTASAPGWVVDLRSVKFVAGQTTELGDLILRAAGSVSGRVLTTGRVAFPKAVVLITEVQPIHGSTQRWRPGKVLLEGETDERGGFRLDSVPAGQVRAWAGARDDRHPWVPSPPLDVLAGGETGDVELLLEPYSDDDLIELLILNPDGTPAARAEVNYEYEGTNRSGSGNSQANGEGLYRHYVQVRVPHTFRVNDREGRYRGVTLEDVAPGSGSRVVQLGEFRSLRLSVRDTDGRPIESFEAVAHVPGEDWKDLASVDDDVPHDDGLAVLSLPTATFELRVTAEGHQIGRLGPFEPAGVIAAIEVVLVPLPGVRGRVRTAGGEPVEGAAVGLHAALTKGRMTVNGFPARSNRHADESDRSAADGTFLITAREAQGYFLRAEARGFAPTEIGPLEIVPELGLDGLEVVLGAGGTLEVRLLVAPGERLRGRIIGLSRGDGNAVTKSTDGEGRVSFERLTPGRWQVEERDQEISPSSTTSSTNSSDPGSEIPWNVEVAEGRTTSFELDRRRDDTVIVAGRILIDGAPLADRPVLLYDDDHKSFPAANTDAHGWFRVRGGRPGRYMLHLRYLFGEEGSPNFSVDLDLETGETPYDITLQTGRVEGRLDPLLASGGFYRWAGPGGERSFLVFEADQSGAFVLERVPSGPAEIHASGRGKTTKLRDIDVRPGGTVRID